MSTFTYQQFREMPTGVVSPALAAKMNEWNQVAQQEVEKMQGAQLVRHLSHTPRVAADTTAFKRTTSLTQISSSRKDINFIRIQMNKLTPGDTFSESAAQCIAHIQKIVEYYKWRVNGRDILREITDVIYLACVSSNLFSEMYADFFGLVNTQLPDLCLLDYLLKKKEEYCRDFDTIVNVSPDEYDLFCRITKQNDVRKYTSLFYTHLLKRNLLTSDQLLQLIRHLLAQIQTKSQLLSDADEKTSLRQIAQLESLVDNVSVLIMFSQSRLSRLDIWYDELVPSLYDMSPQCNERVIFAWKRLLETVDA